jgi:hypothetical protein
VTDNIEPAAQGDDRQLRMQRLAGIKSPRDSDLHGRGAAIVTGIISVSHEQTWMVSNRGWFPFMERAIAEAPDEQIADQLSAGMWAYGLTLDVVDTSRSPAELTVAVIRSLRQTAQAVHDERAASAEQADRQFAVHMSGLLDLLDAELTVARWQRELDYSARTVRDHGSPIAPECQ